MVLSGGLHADLARRMTLICQMLRLGALRPSRTDTCLLCRRMAMTNHRAASVILTLGLPLKRFFTLKQLPLRQMSLVLLPTLYTLVGIPAPIFRMYNAAYDGHQFIYSLLTYAVDSSSALLLTYPEKCNCA